MTCGSAAMCVLPSKAGMASSSLRAIGIVSSPFPPALAASTTCSATKGSEKAVKGQGKAPPALCARNGRGAAATAGTASFNALGDHGNRPVQCGLVA